MRIVRTVRELRGALHERRAEIRDAAGSVAPAAPGAPVPGAPVPATAPAPAPATIGMVPTMGALHEGHLSLMRAARAENDIVVISIFVNPKQFNEASDLDSYPRQEEADAALAKGAGVDLIFAPSADELYPEGFATTVSVHGPLVETLEGASRGSAHFSGMTTVVTKLLTGAMPDRAYFGEKDAQQLAVVRRMVTDLGLPIDIVGCPTSRDSDGLARSSRNVRLDDQAREQALAIPNALHTAAASVAAGERSTAPLRHQLTQALSAAGLTVEYVEFVDPQTFAGVEIIDAPVLCAIAARAGDVRLIDNRLLKVED